MAQVLGDRGVDGFVFRGDDGLDEITLATTTSVLTIGNGEISSDLIDPLDFGISRAPISAATRKTNQHIRRGSWNCIASIPHKVAGHPGKLQAVEI
jgi:anthranilate phosphoribosyltransferase